MELRVLRYFLAVAKEENITRAASKLHLSQPTLSRQLLELEEELGVKLFDRGRYKVSLTKEGLLLKRRAEEIIELSDKTKQEISLKDQEVEGEIILGSGETLALDKVGSLFKEFNKLYPKTRLRVYSGTADELQEALLNGLLDMALVCEPFEPRDLSYIKLEAIDYNVALVPKDHPLAAKSELEPKDLVDYPLIISYRERVQKRLYNYFGPYASKMKVVATFNLGINAYRLVRSGLGIAIGYKLISNDEDVISLPLKGAKPNGAYFIYKDESVSPNATKLFLNYVKDNLKA